MEVKVIGQMDNEIDHTFESANRVYDVDGISPTINTCGGGGLQPKIITDAQPIRMVRTKNGKELRKKYENGTIHHGLNEHREMELMEDGIANTSSTVPKENYICEKTIVAMRGRNPENQNNRTTGVPTEQRLEPNNKGLCNTLTSVQKDNLVLEETIKIKQATKQGYIECELGGAADLSYPNSSTRGGRVQDNGQTSPTLTTSKQDICRIEKVGQISSDRSQYGTLVSDNGLCQTLSAGTHGYSNNCIETQYRIRKLTPKECWHLMDFSDEDFEKASKTNSNTQLYKQAGNSIVRNVLVAILGQMIPGKEEIYKN